MILEGKKADVLSTGAEESIQMGIDQSDQAVLMMILSESLYKDPIGSIVREWTSNALDSHVQAGVTEPIIVDIYRDKQYVSWFKVEDFGLGMSPELVINVISKYAASTKRGSNAYLGCFGLGLKSGLAYSDSFNIITRWEGKEYTYIMYKGEEGTKIDLMKEEATEKGNGTVIEISIKHNSDRVLFQDKIKEQLCYFEGVYFGEGTGVNNSFKIIKAEEWKWSEINKDSSMHLSLDNVYYPIDYKRLKMSPIAMPIAINVAIGEGIIPIPSREDVKYTEEAKTILAAKIARVADYFVSKFNETREEKEYIGDIYDKFNDVTVNIEGRNLNVVPISKVATIQMKEPTLKGVNLINVKDFIFYKGDSMFENYMKRGRIINSNRQFIGYETGHPSLKEMISTTTKYILTDHKPKGVELEYLKDIVPGCFFVYRQANKGLGKLGYMARSEGARYDYYRLLDLYMTPRKLWREKIRQYNLIEKGVIDRLLKIEDLQPTPEWLEQRKLNRKKSDKVQMLEDDINVKEGWIASRGDNILTWNLGTVKMANLAITPHLVVYGNNDEKALLDPYGYLLHSNKNTPSVHFALINKKDINRVKLLQNFMPIEEFKEGKSKPFRRFATAKVIHMLRVKYPHVFNNVEFISLLSRETAAKIEELDAYNKNQYPSVYGDSASGVLDQMVAVAEEFNLWDETIYSLYKEVSDKIHNFDFIKLFTGLILSAKDTAALELAIEVLKGRKVRLNWENYSSSTERPPGVLNDLNLKEKGENDEDEEFEEDRDEEGDIELEPWQEAELAGTELEPEVA